MRCGSWLLGQGGASGALYNLKRVRLMWESLRNKTCALSFGELGLFKIHPPVHPRISKAFSLDILSVG